MTVSVCLGVMSVTTVRVGGAFAPNRFERISTLAAAYAAHLQRQFDASQPPPQYAELLSLQILARCCRLRLKAVLIDASSGLATLDAGGRRAWSRTPST